MAGSARADPSRASLYGHGSKPSAISCERSPPLRPSPPPPSLSLRPSRAILLTGSSMPLPWNMAGGSSRRIAGCEGTATRSDHRVVSRRQLLSRVRVNGVRSVRSEFMEHVNLGRTGLVVSRICLGTMTFGKQCDEETSRGDPRRRRRRRRDVPRHRRRLPPRRRPRHGRADRRDRRAMAAGQARSSSSSPRSASGG